MTALDLHYSGLIERHSNDEHLQATKYVHICTHIPIKIHTPPFTHILSNIDNTHKHTHTHAQKHFSALTSDLQALGSVFQMETHLLSFTLIILHLPCPVSLTGAHQSHMKKGGCIVSITIYSTICFI